MIVASEWWVGESGKRGKVVLDCILDASSSTGYTLTPLQDSHCHLVWLQVCGLEFFVRLFHLVPASSLCPGAHHNSVVNNVWLEPALFEFLQDFAATIWIRDVRVSEHEYGVSDNGRLYAARHHVVVDTDNHRESVVPEKCAHKACVGVDIGTRKQDMFRWGIDVIQARQKLVVE